MSNNRIAVVCKDDTQVMGFENPGSLLRVSFVGLLWDIG